MDEQRESEDRYGSRRHPGPGDARGPVWTATSGPQELSIQEHAEAIALVDELRPYCGRWIVELQRPEIAREIGMIVLAEGAVPAWAIYRDDHGMLHFEDLIRSTSYLFGTMSAGLRLARAVLEAAAVLAAEQRRQTTWWDRLPGWLIAPSAEV